MTQKNLIKQFIWHAINQYPTPCNITLIYLFFPLHINARIPRVSEASYRTIWSVVRDRATIDNRSVGLPTLCQSVYSLDNEA